MRSSIGGVLCPHERNQYNNCHMRDRQNSTMLDAATLESKSWNRRTLRRKELLRTKHKQIEMAKMPRYGSTMRIDNADGMELMRLKLLAAVFLTPGA